MIALELWIACLVSSVTFCACTAALARALGARVRAAVIFIGPPILRLSLGGVPVHVAAVPIPTGYVSFEPTGGDDEPERTHFHDLSRARRIAILALPWIAIALGCIAILGPERGLGAIGRGFPQLVLGALSPNETGPALIARLVELAESEPPHVLGALVIAKLVAFNLFPLPGLAGFALPTELLRRSSSRLGRPSRLAIAGPLAMLALAALWTWALVAYWLALPGA